MGGARAYVAQAQCDFKGRGPPYLQGLDPGQSDAAVAERRLGPTGPDPQEHPSCEEVSVLTCPAGPGRRVRRASRPREAESRPPVRAQRLPAPTAWPGLALVRRGLECAAFASRLPAFPRYPGRAGRSFPFRPSCRPLPLPAFSRPASRMPLPLASCSSARVSSRVLCAAAPLQSPLRVRGWPGRAGPKP